jgi:hypothetical protein
MTYPTNPALNSAQALYPNLWDGLVWAYLPGYNKNTTIVGSDTLSGADDTTLQTYDEGIGEVIPLGKFRQGSTTPLEGSTAGSVHAYYRMLWTNDGTPAGILSTAPSTTWLNAALLAVRNASGTIRGAWLRNGQEAIANASVATHNASTNPVVNAITWRNASVVGVRDRLVGETTASATNITGALTSTESAIVGSYYGKPNARSANIAFFCGAIWTRDLTLAERELLDSDPYAIFRLNENGEVDTTEPQTSGDVTFTSVTQTSYTANWLAATDNVGVTGYEYQIGSTAGTWTDVGNVLSTNISSRTPSTTEIFYVRAYDATGNRSTPVSGEVTLLSPTSVTVALPFVFNTGTVRGNESNLMITVLSSSNLSQVLSANSFTTDSNGYLSSIVDENLISGNNYHVVVKASDGSVCITGEITAS